MGGLVDGVSWYFVVRLHHYYPVKKHLDFLTLTFELAPGAALAGRTYILSSSAYNKPSVERRPLDHIPYSYFNYQEITEESINPSHHWGWCAARRAVTKVQ